MAEVRWKITADDTEARKKLQGIKRLQDDIQKQGEAIIRRLKDAGSGAITSASSGEAKSAKDVASATNEATKAKIAAAQATKQNREEQLAFMQALRESRLKIQEEREEQARLKTALDEGKISIQKYREEMARLNLEEKKRRDEKRRQKEILDENSQYRQLSKTLGDLRQRSKDVLAEMFVMEGQGKKNTIAYKQLASEARGLVSQTQYLDRGLKKIDASLGIHYRNVGNYAGALDALSPTFARLNSQLAMMGISLEEVASSRNGFQQLGATLVGLGKNIGAFLISPIGLAITAVTGLFLLFQRNKKTVIDFNNGLLNVSKTTGLTGAELDSLSDSIIRLSRSLQTVGTDKLLEYATVAGQLGVKGTENILNFTEALAKLEIASDISGEEGGSNIARLLTLVDGGVQNVKAFGDEIVNLGNNFAATEGEILDNATQIAQNVGIYRIGRQEVLAFATATKAVGLEAELVGSTFSRTLGEFEKTLRTGKGVADLLKVIGGNQQELQRRFREDAAGVFVDYVRGLNRIHTEGGSVNAELEKTGIVAVRDQRVIASLASNGFGVLEDALVKVREAAGAMDAEFETASGKLVNQTERISIAWNNLVLSIENGTGAIGKMSVAVIGFFADVLEGLTNVVTSESWGEFFERINPQNWGNGDQITDAREWKKAYNDILAFNKQIQSMGSGSNDWIENHFRGLSRSEFEDQFKQAEDNYKRITDAAQKYEAAVLSGRMQEDELTVNHYKKQESLARLHLSRMRKLQRELGYQPAGSAVSGNGPSTEESELTKQELSQREAAIQGQRQLQKQIDDMNRASLRSTLDKDEQEVESVREKYRKIRAEIDAFRKDPKNKGLAVDASGLSASEAREVSQVKYRQDTEQLLKELGIQRQLWQDYESWRMDLGEESAKQRFSNELGLIQGFKDRIKTEISTIGGLLTASLDGGPNAPKLTGAEEERLKQLQDLLKQIEDTEQRQRDDNLRRALTDYATFEQKRARLREQANADMELLDEKGRQIRKKALEEELIELYRTEIEVNERLKELMKQYDNAGSSIALTALKHGKSYVMNLIDGLSDATTGQKGQLKKIFGEFFDGAIEQTEQENFNNVARMVDGFGRLVDLAGQFDGTLVGSLKTIASMVSQVGELANTLGQTLQSAGGSLSKIGGYAGIFGAILGAVGSIADLFNRSRERRSQEAQEDQAYVNELQLKQTEAITKALERQLSLINEVYGTDRLNKYAESLESIRENYQTINNDLDGLFERTGHRFTDSVLEQLNRGMSRKAILKSFGRFTEEWAQALNIFDNIDKGRANQIEKLPDDINEAREALEQLQFQADRGLLDDYTANLVEQLQKQVELYNQTLNELRAETTGTTFSGLADEIANIFRQGTESAQEFADNFEKIMQNAIIQSLKRNVLEKELQAWYELFAESAESDGQLTSEEVAKLQQDYNSIIENAKRQFEQLKEVSGVEFEQVSTTPNSLSGAYARASQESIDLLAGQTGAMRLHLYELVKLASTNNSNTVNQIDIMNGQLNALIAIERNTGVTAQHSMEYLPYLKSMDTKMGDSLGLQLRAAGKYGF